MAFFFKQSKILYPPKSRYGHVRINTGLLLSKFHSKHSIYPVPFVRTEYAHATYVYLLIAILHESLECEMQQTETEKGEEERGGGYKIDSSSFTVFEVLIHMYIKLHPWVDLRVMTSLIRIRPVRALRMCTCKHFCTHANLVRAHRVVRVRFVAEEFSNFGSLSMAREDVLDLGKGRLKFRMIEFVLTG